MYVYIYIYIYTSPQAGLVQALADPRFSPCRRGRPRVPRGVRGWARVKQWVSAPKGGSALYDIF